MQHQFCHSRLVRLNLRSIDWVSVVLYNMDAGTQSYIGSKMDKILCALCFEWTSREDLWKDEDQKLYDVCMPCVDMEEEIMRRIAKQSESYTRIAAHPFQEHHNALQAPDGGFSINPLTGGKPTKRYMVAQPGHEQVFEPGQITPDDIQNHATKTQHLYGDPNMYQGGWTDPDSGKHYLDASRNMGDIDSAMDQARKNNELSIFDLHSGKSIPTA